MYQPQRVDFSPYLILDYSNVFTENLRKYANVSISFGYLALCVCSHRLQQSFEKSKAFRAKSTNKPLHFARIERFIIEDSFEVIHYLFPLEIGQKGLDNQRNVEFFFMFLPRIKVILSIYRSSETLALISFQILLRKCFYRKPTKTPKLFTGSHFIKFNASYIYCDALS